MRLGTNQSHPYRNRINNLRLYTLDILRVVLEAVDSLCDVISRALSISKMKAHVVDVLEAVARRFGKEYRRDGRADGKEPTRSRYRRRHLTDTA